MAKLIVRPAQKWMREERLPEGEWLLCWVQPYGDWWDTDDAVGALPGARRVWSCNAYRIWRAVPAQSWRSLKTLLAERNCRALVYGPVQGVAD